MTNIFYTGLNFPFLDVPAGLKLMNTPTIHISFNNQFDLNKTMSFLDLNPIPIFMSKNAVRGFEKILSDNKIKSFNPQYCYCIGKLTANLLSTIYNWKINIPKQSNSMGMIDLIKKEKNPLLFVSAKHTRFEILRWASKHHQLFFHLPAYETTSQINLDLQHSFRNVDEEIIIFTSPSTISGFLLSAGLDNLSDINSKLISIGPTTSKAITKSRGSVFFESKEQNTTKLLKSVLEGNYRNGISCADTMVNTLDTVEKMIENNT